MAQVLVVDDSRTSFWAARKFLDLDGLTAIWIDCLDSLRRHIGQVRPSLVLLDVYMTTGTTRELAELVRSGTQPPAPIILYSSCSQSQIQDTAREPDAAAVFQKGGAARVFRSVLQRVLAQSAGPP